MALHGAVTVVGSLNMDLVVRAARLPTPGETVPGSGFAEHPGGKGCNQAVAARRAGATVELAGRVGADAFGERLLHLLHAEGVGHAGVGADPAGTGVAVIAVDAAGANSIVVVPRANGLLTAAHVTAFAPSIAAADVLLLQGEVPLAACLCAAEIAAAAGCVVVLNPAPVPPPGAPLQRLLALADWVLPNETELRSLTACAGPAAGALALRARTGGDVLVTLGEQGALWQEAPGGAARAFPAYAVAAVDTVGAGDAFAGAFAAALAGGAPPAEAIPFAAAAGSLACTRMGAVEAMPTRAEILQLLRREGPARRGSRS